MFTGLVRGQGKVLELQPEPGGLRLIVSADCLGTGREIGASICVNGCCLTLVEQQSTWFAFQAGEETLSKTNLGDLRAGDLVNLEPSLAVGDELGGHFVTGHVDGTGPLLARTDDPPWANLEFGLPAQLLPEIARKGSIAVNGVSLTVVSVHAASFTVALIPHTLEQTNLGQIKVGGLVNLETDLFAKYVRRVLDVQPRP